MIKNRNAYMTEMIQLIPEQTNVSSEQLIGQELGRCPFELGLGEFITIDSNQGKLILCNVFRIEWQTDKYPHISLERRPVSANTLNNFVVPQL